MTSDRTPPDSAAWLLDPRVIDPSQELVKRSAMDDDEVDSIVGVLAALRTWREAEQAMSEASQKHMKLNATDMKALRFLMASRNVGAVVTPGLLAETLRISTASTTKLLDRLERAGHVLRSPHPTDRRALMITVTDATRTDARESVGRIHARRFEAAARLSPEERDIVIRFLSDLSAFDEGAGADQ
ncbi:MarR family winged helix-turn-helix transcriptional regulator [Mycetocola sp.]|uniref:MarR family winged helix-turn-helix transcriptional regulator n=1 Tax=Mycetocola sp. TaxID=1871042 RepID=UPI0039899B44